MIRVLFMIAIAGFVLSVATLSAAVAIGGPEVISRGGWTIAAGDWKWRDDDAEVRRGHYDWPHDTGPEGSRTIAWSGADKLDIDLAADVRYVQAEGPATVTITGPQRAIERVIVRGDSIRYESRRQRGYPRVGIVLRAPNIRTFDVSGRNSLAIENYRQPKLNLDVSGDAEVTIKGEADELNLDLSGSGQVDAGSLKTRGVSADVSGSGDITIAPTDWANLDISGAGDARLLTRPQRLETEISGSGRVRQEDRTTSPSPTPPPAPAPSPKGAKL